MVESAGAATITDTKQDFTDWDTTSGTVYEYCITAIDAKGNKLYGWLGGTSNDGDTIDIYDARVISGAAQNWIGSTGDFDPSGDVEYIIKKS